MSKQGSKFLALLRGINVGGRNIISKEDLKDCFEKLGYESVRTYIQSGNILFRSEITDTKELTATIEQGLSKRFNYDAQAVIISQRKYKSMLSKAHDNWGEDEDWKHNAMFLLSGTTPKKVLSQIADPKVNIETVSHSTGIIFWSTLKKQQTKATVMKLAAHPVYKQMTVRNHNTCFKLLKLFDEI